MEHLIQGSQQWLELRKTKITGTDAGIIYGVNPFKTKYTLWLQKKGKLPPDEENEVMRRGSMLEEEARQLYQNVTGIQMLPSVKIHHEMQWAMGSLDGISFDGDKILEIKCGIKAFEAAQRGEIPDYYYAQIQHCIFVANAKECDYFCYDGENYILNTIQRDQQYITDLLAQEALFFICLTDDFPPEMREGDLVLIEDDEFIAHAKEWIEVNSQLKEIKKQEAEIRAKLLEFTDDGDVIGGGIKISRVDRDGAVDYQKIIEEYNVDISKYRKPQIGYYKIKEL